MRGVFNRAAAKAHPLHEWGKPPRTGWVCTFFGTGRYACEGEAVVFCDANHGDGTCLEGRCKKHAPERHRGGSVKR